MAYALMVLAREGAAAVGDLRYYADVKGDAFATPTAMAQLGAGLASYGDQPRADAMFARAAKAMETLQGAETEQIFRADYGTNFRDAAAVLALAATRGMQYVEIALELGIGERTVRKYAGAIRRTLRAATMVQAAHIATKAGLL